MAYAMLVTTVNIFLSFIITPLQLELNVCVELGLGSIPHILNIGEPTRQQK